MPYGCSGAVDMCSLVKREGNKQMDKGHSVKALLIDLLFPGMYLDVYVF